MTLGELVQIATAKRREDWERHSKLLAAVLNGACTRKDNRPWNEEDFNIWPKPKVSDAGGYRKVSASEFIDRLGRVR